MANPADYEAVYARALFLRANIQGVPHGTNDALILHMLQCALADERAHAYARAEAAESALAAAQAERDAFREKCGDALGGKMRAELGLAAAQEALRRLLNDRGERCEAFPYEWPAPQRTCINTGSERCAACQAVAALTPSQAGAQPEKSLTRQLGDLLEGVPVCFCMTCKHQPDFGPCSECRCGNPRGQAGAHTEEKPE